VDDPTTSGVTEGFGLTCTRQGVFYNARYYDPALGRFAQADSIIPGGAQGLDRFAYVNNNPIRYTDPSGHLTEEEWIKRMGQKRWDLFKGLISKEKLAFLLSASFNFGNIVAFKIGENVYHFLIGEDENGGIAFWDVNTHRSYVGADSVSYAIIYTEKWRSYIRSGEDNLGGKYDVYTSAPSNQCPFCDNTIPVTTIPSLFSERNPNFMPGSNGFMLIRGWTPDNPMSYTIALGGTVFGAGAILIGGVAAVGGSMTLDPILAGWGAKAFRAGVGAFVTGAVALFEQTVTYSHPLIVDISQP